MIDGLEGGIELTTLLREMQTIKKELADLKYHVEIRVSIKLGDLLNQTRMQLALLLLIIVLVMGD